MIKKPLIHAVIAFVALLIAIGGYAYWHYLVSTKSAEAESLGNDIATAIAESEQAAATRAALESLATDEAALRGYFIATDDIVPFLEVLETTGRNLGADVEVAAVSDAPGADGRITLSLRITGSFDAVLRTVGAIEYGPYDSRVENLTIEATPLDASSWNATGVFSVGVASAQ